MNFAKFAVFVGLALGATGFFSCSIPKPECTVGQTGYLGGLSGNDYLAFATRYVVDQNPQSCPVIQGEIVGFQSYHPATGDGTNRDFSKTSIAIRPQNLGELTWAMEDWGVTGAVVNPNGLGDFTAPDPDSSDFCQVPTVSAQEVNVPEILDPITTTVACTADLECQEATVACEVGPDDPDCVGGEKVAAVFGPNANCAPAGELNVCNVACADDTECADVPNVPGPVCREGSCVSLVIAATDLKYEWKDVQFYVTAAALGTQVSANVTITLNGCAATYKAVGMWPAVDCSGFTIEATDTTPEIVVTPESMCNPEADALNGRPFGSGINPDFGPVKCDTGFAVVPSVDQYYTNFIYGYPLSVPRCALAADEIPALEGFGPATTE